MPQRTCDIEGCERKHRARGLCATHYNQRNYTPAERHPKHQAECVICKAKVIRRVDSTYKPTCSVACRRAVQCGQLLATSSPYEWRTDAQRRAREHGCHTIEDFDRLEIFERDAWTCYLCDRLCVEPDPFNPAAATVDHVIPMTRGGQHTRANVRTACLGCNSSKSDRISHAA